jgi:hypothetical protein
VAGTNPLIPRPVRKYTMHSIDAFPPPLRERAANSRERSKRLNKKLIKY